MFVLKLLGVWRFLKKFFLENWKWLVPVIVVILGFLWTKEHYYNLGVTAEKVKWEARIKEETDKNQKLTESLANSAVTFGQIALAEDKSRTDKEIRIEKRIETLVEKPMYTECTVDLEILTQQNALKALGENK